MMRVRRRGLSTLSIALLIVLVVAFIQLAQHLFLARVSDHTSRVSHGIRAVEVVEAAVAETHRRLSEQLNDPAAALFAMARGRLLSEESITASMPLERLPRTTAMLRDLHGTTFKLSAPDVRIEKHNPLSYRDPLEINGVVSITARVETTLEPLVERRLERSWAFRLVRPMLTPPMTRASLVILRPLNLLTMPHDVNVRSVHFVRETLPGLRDQLVELIAKLEEARNQAEAAAAIPMSPGAAMARQVAQVLKEALRSYGDLKDGPGVPNVTSSLTAVPGRLGSLPPFPDPKQLILVSTAQEEDLSTLYLQEGLDGDFREYEGELEVEARQREDVDARMQQKDFGAGTVQAIRSHTEACRVLLARMEAIADRIGRFRARFERVEASESPLRHAELTQGWERLSPIGLDEASGNPMRRAEYVVMPDPSDSGPLQGKLENLFARLGRPESGLHGIIVVLNQGLPPVRLGGAQRGRWTLAVAGDLDLEDVTLADPGQDLVTVTCRGALRCRGRIQASIVHTGQQLEIADGARIEGHLILFDLLGFDQGARGRLDHVRGGLQRDARLDDVAEERLGAFILSPWQRGMNLDRDL